MKKVFILLVFVFIACSTTFACDVNLFTIISGVSKDDSFALGMEKLVQKLRMLGEGYESSDLAGPRLTELMSEWLDFSNKFSMFPPEWARKDKNWQKKFTELASLIGLIRQNLAGDAEKSHAAMLKFSRKLPQLYELMPMSERARILMEITACFDTLWDSYYEKDKDKLKSAAPQLLELCQQLLPQLEKKKDISELENLQEFAEQIRISSTQVNVFNTRILHMVLLNAEAQYVRLNEQLSASP